MFVSIVIIHFKCVIVQALSWRHNYNDRELSKQSIRATHSRGGPILKIVFHYQVITTIMKSNHASFILWYYHISLGSFGMIMISEWYIRGWHTDSAGRVWYCRWHLYFIENVMRKKHLQIWGCFYLEHNCLSQLPQWLSIFYESQSLYSIFLQHC